ncbi:MAG: YdcF family protein [Symbiobacteriia bacterium]
MDRRYEGMSIREISDFLFVQDEPDKADLILVIGGRRQERAGKAVDLYLRGLAPKILFSGGDKQGTGIAEALRLRDWAVERGVRVEDILVEDRAVNTMENVLYSCALIDREIGFANLNAVILISSPMHMRRVRQSFARHCPPNVRLMCIPDDRQDVSRDNWWVEPMTRESVLRELEKVRDYAHKGEI